MPTEPGMTRRRSSSRNPREAPAELELTRQIWAAGASAGQVRNWRVAAEARRLKRSNIHRCRVMSRGEGGECRTAGSSAVLRGMGSDTVLGGTGS